MPAACPLLSRVSSLLSSTQLLPTFATSRTKVGGRLVGGPQRQGLAMFPASLACAWNTIDGLLWCPERAASACKTRILGVGKPSTKDLRTPRALVLRFLCSRCQAGSLTMGQVALRGVVEGEVDQKSAERCSHPPLICQADIPAAKGRGMLANCLHKWYSRKPARGISSTIGLRQRNADPGETTRSEPKHLRIGFRV